MNLLLILLFLNQVYQNPFCKDSGFELSPDSPARGYGVLTELHCSTPGPHYDDSGCIWWYDDPPDVGSCPFTPTDLPLSGELVATITP
jgi:hypothetical protein